MIGYESLWGKNIFGLKKERILLSKWSLSSASQNVV